LTKSPGESGEDEEEEEQHALSQYAMLIFVGQIYVLLYTAFVLCYVPAAHISLLGPSSIFTHINGIL